MGSPLAGAVQYQSQASRIRVTVMVSALLVRVEGSVCEGEEFFPRDRAHGQVGLACDTVGSQRTGPMAVSV
jgi:hypothetical protein